MKEIMNFYCPLENPTHIACHQAIALWSVEVYPQAPKWHLHQENPATSRETL